MRSPIPQPPASPIMFTNYREKSVLSVAGLLSSQLGNATPMAQDFGSILPAREDRFDSRMPVTSGNSYVVAEDVYRICLEATQEYIGDFKRHVELERHRRTPVVSWPSISAYAIAPRNLPKEDILFEFVSQHAQVTGSFENHVKTVCNILWARDFECQRIFASDGRNTLSVMSRVIDAADSIMKAQHDLNDNSRDWTISVLRNGMDFCRHLQKFKGRDEIKRIGDEKLGFDWNGIRGFNEVFC